PSGDNGASHTLFVNGIGTSSGEATSEAQTLANNSNSPIDLVYQQTDRTSTILGDIAKLALQATSPIPIFGSPSVNTVKQSLDNPAAAKTLSDSIISQLGSPGSNNQVRLVGYSQGGHISAEALNSVNQQLTQRYGADTAKQMLRNVHVLEIGGAA